MSLVVECVGIPGSGKSHLTSLIVDACVASSIECRAPMLAVAPSVGTPNRVTRRLLMAASEFARAPAHTVRAVKATFRSGQPSLGGFVRRTLSWTTQRSLVRAARGREGISVFDQGTLMELWSTGLRGDADGWRELLEGKEWRWLLPDVVIWVDVPTETAAFRLNDRVGKQSRLEELDSAVLSATLDTSRAALHQTVEWWQQTVERDGDYLLNGSDWTDDGAGASSLANALAALAHRTDDTTGGSPTLSARRVTRRTRR